MVIRRYRAQFAAAAVGVAFVVVGVVWIARSLPSETNPERLVGDPDFQTQGEYLHRSEELTVGMQVVALGGGRFEGVLCPGGLPGEGWDGGPTRPRSRAKRDAQGIVAFRFPGQRAYLVGSEIVLVDEGAEGAEPAPPGGTSETRSSGPGARVVLSRVERVSPDLGTEPPPGAVVLFDGSAETAEARWRDARLDGELLREGAVSRRGFGDCRIFLEFRVPWMPRARGQARGNSGVYIASRYEVQILDSFGLERSHDGGGAIYRVAPPAVNVCLPPLSWQTYEIDYTAARFDGDGRKISDARISLRHNGVLVHDDVPVPGPTGGASSNDENSVGPLRLQRHGNPVRFRNVWIEEIGNS